MGVVIIVIINIVVVAVAAAAVVVSGPAHRVGWMKSSTPHCPTRGWAFVRVDLSHDRT